MNGSQENFWITILCPKILLLSMTFITWKISDGKSCSNIENIFIIIQKIIKIA